MSKKPASELDPGVFRQEYHWHAVNAAAGIGEIGCGFVPRTDSRPYRAVAKAEYFGLIYLLRGSGRVTHGRGRPRTVRAGDVIQVPPRCALAITPHRAVPWFEAFVCLDAAFIARAADLCGMDLRKPVLRLGLDPLLVQEFQKITSELAHHTPHSLWGTLLRAVELVQAIHLAARRGGSDAAEDLIAAKACRMLQVDLASRLDIEEVASSLGVGYHHFRRLFRKHFGISPGQYRIHCRLQRARTMLQHEGKNVSEVADALGYADPFVFSKQFRQEVGRPPSAFLP